jgi:subtilisin family serine protease
MWKVLLPVFFILTISMAANAEHWIIKNPKQMINLDTMENLNSYSTLDLKNQYLILDLNNSNDERTASQLVQFFNAESAFQDVEITMDAPNNEPPPPESDKGWHVDFLQYSKLNKKFTGQGVTVAIIDGGVDYTHPALVKNMWKNKNEIPNNGIDDDNNGLIDDYDGYNFVDNNTDIQDPFGHGTHCAGIVAASADKK